jgi:hypothetical protein
MTFYFDTRTGRRVNKATWKRSKAHGGTRYKRRTTKKKPPPPPPKPQEYVLRADYGTRKNNNQINFQVHLFGPANASDEQIITAVHQYNHKQQMPAGWDIRTINYRHGTQATHTTTYDRMLSTPLNGALNAAPTIMRENLDDALDDFGTAEPEDDNDQ